MVDKEDAVKVIDFVLTGNRCQADSLDDVSLLIQILKANFDSLASVDLGIVLWDRKAALFFAAFTFLANNLRVDQNQ